MESRLGIPLPKVVADVGPGGGIPSAVNALNEIQKQTIANRLAPLEQMIKAQNALAYTSKTGNIGTYLRALSQMPVAERQAYLADPANRQNYMAMLEQFRTGVNQPDGGNVLTPQYIQSVMGGGGGMGGGNDIFSYLGNKIFGGGQQNAMAQPPQQAPQQSQMQGNPMAQNQVDDYEQILNPMAQAGQAPQAQTPIQQPVQLPQTTSQEMPQKEGQQYKSPIERIPSSDDIKKQQESLTHKQRDGLRAQMDTNNKSIGKAMQKRADASTAFDVFMMTHRKEIAQVFSKAFYYNHLYGRAANWMDRFKSEQPEEYADYQKAKKSLIPLIGNGIRFIEDMGVSHEAQLDAKAQAEANLGKLDTSLETALELFNSHIRALGDLSHGIMTAAEPTYPGVRRKLSGVPEFPKEFIPKETYVQMLDEKGDEWTVPEYNVPLFKTNGYKLKGSK